MKPRSVVTLVLAAGSGTRMGGPKALLLWSSGKPPVERPLAIAHAEERLSAESSQVLIVVRKDVLGALLPFTRPGLDLLTSTAPEELGPSGSLAFAASRFPNGGFVVVAAVDSPPARADTVAKLIDRLEADPTLMAVRPSYHGKSGHPIALRVKAIDRYRAKNPPAFQEYLRTLGPKLAFELVSDPTVLVELNTPADVQGLLGTPVRFAS